MRGGQRPWQTADDQADPPPSRARVEGEIGTLGLAKMVYWIREFKDRRSGDRFRVYGEATESLHFGRRSPSN